jgi:hypothetical protein
MGIGLAPRETRIYDVLRIQERTPGVTSTILGQGGRVKRSLFDDTKLGKEEGFGPRELKD